LEAHSAQAIPGKSRKMPLTCPDAMNTFCAVIRTNKLRLLESALLLSSAAVGF
jgi:hypothetical protein